MHIAMLAGEASGDILGAGLIQALKVHYPHARFSGIGGERMQAVGLESLFAMDRLSVMGLVEPLKRLPELLRIRKRIKQHCLEEKVDVFIGIDSPDFNLNIERFVKRHGIPSVHYVSPSVWAWRQGRIKGIKKSVDLMLTLLPFEAAFYQQHQVPVCFVGHPLADEIALQTDTQAARKTLGVDVDKHVLCLMPGSRAGEVEKMAALFLQVAEQLPQQDNSLFLLPAANAARKTQIHTILQRFPNLPVRVLDGQSHLAMAAADAVLLASGTTALEAMLFKKPMVVAYKASALSYAIISRMVKSRFVSLPNLLADAAIVPELIQDNARLETLLPEVEKALYDSHYREAQLTMFYTLHQSLQADASKTAATAIAQLLNTQ